MIKGHALCNYLFRNTVVPNALNIHEILFYKFNI